MTAYTNIFIIIYILNDVNVCSFFDDSAVLADQMLNQKFIDSDASSVSCNLF